MKKIISISILSSSLLLASGYRLPESSINSTALSGAYIANANGADASYYNPANMAFDNKNSFEADLTYINLSKIEYHDFRNPLFNSKSEVENIIAPSLFFASKNFNGIHYGLSLNVPGGLSKKWNSPYAQTFAKEFNLKILEFNPSLAYKLNNQLSIGGGLRVIYSKGTVKSDGTKIGKPAIRDMEADTTKFGYNLAISYRPIEHLKLASTYRSNVNLNHKGNAKLYLSGTKLYDGGASIEIPLPAVAAIAISYDFADTTVEFEYDKTMWSKYKSLDFKFKDSVPRALKGAFDDPKPREWKDSDAFRLGITHQLNEDITLMAGIAKDQTPAPDKNLGFELPDSDATIFSGGMLYKYSDELSFGTSFLYDKKDDRTVKNEVVNGKFHNASAILATFGAKYKF